MHQVCVDVDGSPQLPSPDVLVGHEHQDFRLHIDRRLGLDSVAAESGPTCACGNAIHGGVFCSLQRF
jgi:hypothetical protein